MLAKNLETVASELPPTSGLSRVKALTNNCFDAVVVKVEDKSTTGKRTEEKVRDFLV